MKLPNNAKIVEIKKYMSGEITLIYYLLEDKLYKIYDWAWDKPHEARWEEIENGTR